jgi:hypothetical protein
MRVSITILLGSRETVVGSLIAEYFIKQPEERGMAEISLGVN